MVKSTLPATANSVPDIVGIGYPALRATFNNVLADCQKHLTGADLDRAQVQLGIGEQLYEDALEIFSDMALYARPEASRKRQHRAIDRITKKIVQKRDPLVALIAQALPAATFSIFEFKGVDDEGGVELCDLLDQRKITVMDNALAANGKPGFLFAARFIELGPWHIGFGIVVALRKSEVLALLTAASMTEDLAEIRESLQQVVYASQIHDLDLVRAALDPLIDLLVEKIDESPADISALLVQFKSTLNRGA